MCPTVGVDMVLVVFPVMAGHPAVQWRPHVLLQANDDGERGEHVHCDIMVELIDGVIITNLFTDP